jgi:hypothetical protein
MEGPPLLGTLLAASLEQTLGVAVEEVLAAGRLTESALETIRDARARAAALEILPETPPLAWRIRDAVLRCCSRLGTEEADAATARELLRLAREMELRLPHADAVLDAYWRALATLARRLVTDGRTALETRRAEELCRLGEDLGFRRDRVEARLRGDA